MREFSIAVVNSLSMALQFDKLRRDIVGRLPDLVGERAHSAYVVRQRAEAIGLRVRLVSAAFAALTLFWIVLDRLTLPEAQASVLLLLRLISAAVFTGLAMAPAAGRWARPALALMLLNPLVFYVSAQLLFRDIPLDGPALLNVRLYQALPFVVMAGISAFPLTLIEAGSFAGGVLVIAAVGRLASGSSWIDQFSTLWVLALMLGVCMLACALQLQYMIALLRRASQDALTGCLSRPVGAELLDMYFDLARRQQAPFTVAFLDIDNFKSINDRYGHEAGDETLRGTVATLRGLLRRSDILIRWGGEEFVLLLPNTDAGGSGVVIRRILENGLGRRPDDSLVTASIGLAEARADATDAWTALVDLADKRMYQAKHSGKACCFGVGDRRVS